jgi:hypothetical protein
VSDYQSVGGERQEISGGLSGESRNREAAIEDEERSTIFKPPIG